VDVSGLPSPASLSWAQGDGKGITTKYGMVVIANLHDPRIVKMADGEIFQTISQGKNLMQGYAANITQKDRWAIIAYVRALQLSRLGSLDDVPGRASRLIEEITPMSSHPPHLRPRLGFCPVGAPAHAIDRGGAIGAAIGWPSAARSSSVLLAVGVHVLPEPLSGLAVPGAGASPV